MSFKTDGKRTLALALLVSGLSGCFFGLFGDDEPSYPPLKVEELTGCWKGGVSFLFCEEICFSETKQFYSIYKKYEKSLPSEDYGNWEFSGRNSVSYTYRSIYNKAGGGIETSDRPYGGGGQFWKVGEDTLMQQVNKGPKPIEYMFKRSDTASSCGPHWQLFSKPADWELW